MALNLHHLRYFHAIAQAGGLVKAAQRLNVSPSAVSVQLQALEAQLGHDLFERRGRQLVLTEVGRMALERADAIFDAADELESAIKGVDREKRTAIRVGALATLSRNFQMAFLRPILDRDDVRIVLRSGSMRELMHMLDAHHIDVLLSNTLPPRDETTNWTSHLISDQSISLIGPPTAKRAKSPTALLATVPLIVPTPENHIRGEFDAFAQRIGVAPRIVAEVDDMALLRLLAREGLGYAIVPPIVVRDELAANLLKECGPLPGLKETFYSITPTRRFPNPVLKDLMRAKPNAKRTSLPRSSRALRER